MKNLFLIFSLLLSTSLWANITYHTKLIDASASYNNSSQYEVVTLLEGDKFTLLASEWTDKQDNRVEYSNSSYDIVDNIILKRDGYEWSQILIGPGTVFIDTSIETYVISGGVASIGSMTGKLLISYSIESTSDRPLFSQYNIVTIPSTTEGDQDILLESSTDLINWEPVYSITHNPNSGGRFFRTRISAPE